MPHRRRPVPFRVVAGMLRPALSVITRRTWRGGEHLPATGGFIVVGNHVSNFDPLTVGHFLHDHGAPPRYLAKDSLFDLPALGWVLRSMGQIPVARRTAEAGEALMPAEAALRAGECVVVFPEGTHTRDPGLWPMRGKTGAARLALRTRVPVVPVAQWGAQLVIPRFEAAFRPFPPKPVTVVAGPPVDLTDLYGRALDGDVLTEATTRMMAAVTDLLAQVRGEEPPSRPYDMRVDGDPRAAYDAARAQRRSVRLARRAAARERRALLAARAAGVWRPRAARRP